MQVRISGDGVTYDSINGHPVKLFHGSGTPTQAEFCLAAAVDKRLMRKENVLIAGAGTGITSIVCCRNSVQVLTVDECEIRLSVLKSNVRLNGGNRWLDTVEATSLGEATAHRTGLTMIVLGDTVDKSSQNWAMFDFILSAASQALSPNGRILFLLEECLQNEVVSKLQSYHLSQVEFHPCHDNIVFVEATYTPQQDKTKVEAASASSTFSFSDINGNEKKRPGAASSVLRAGILNKKFVDSVTYQHCTCNSDAVKCTTVDLRQTNHLCKSLRLQMYTLLTSWY